MYLLLFHLSLVQILKMSCASDDASVKSQLFMFHIVYMPMAMTCAYVFLTLKKSFAYLKICPFFRLE